MLHPDAGSGDGGIGEKRLFVLHPIKTQGGCVWMTMKPTFLVLDAPMPPAWVYGCPHVEDLALPKALQSGNFILCQGCPVDVGSKSSVVGEKRS
jgi:hypothetical protein